MSTHIVVAIGKNRELGKDGKLLWHISDDLKRFKELTTGHPVIMGRKTFESILSYLGKPLPYRTNIVITRDTSYKAPDGVIVANSTEEALESAKKIDSEVFVAGGAQIYEAALPYTDTLHLTCIEEEAGADTFFPPYEHLFTNILKKEERTTPEGVRYSWIDLSK